MDFTVVLQQNAATVASTTVGATFRVRGTVCIAEFRLTATAAGTVGTNITVVPTGLPAPRQTAYTNYCRGWFRYTDADSNECIGPVRWDGTTLSFRNLGLSPSIAVASGDFLSAVIHYTIA